MFFIENNHSIDIFIIRLNLKKIFFFSLYIFSLFYLFNNQETIEISNIKKLNFYCLLISRKIFKKIKII